MFKILTHNFTIKLGCLLAASFLWIYVSAGQNTIGKFPSSLRIKTVNVPSGLVAIYDIKTVNIKVMAEPATWRQLSADSFSAYIDLTGVSAGTQELPVIVVSSVPGVQIVEKDPDKVMISLETIISKEVSINKKIEGKAGEGLVNGPIVTDPEKVTVRGAKSIVENINEATIKITLKGETEDFQKVVPVIATDNSGEVLTDIEFTPSEVDTTVPIVKASNNKTVGIKIITTGQPKTGHYLSALTATPSTIDITGASVLIDETAYVETMPVDITSLSSNTEKTINLNLANGISLQAGSPEAIKIKLELSKNQISREIIPTISYVNLDTNLRVESVSPSQVRVICSGPADVVNGMKSSDLILVLDTKGKTSGEVNFDVTKDSFRSPEGISVSSVLPSSLTVTLSRK